MSAAEYMSSDWLRRLYDSRCRRCISSVMEAARLARLPAAPIGLGPDVGLGVANAREDVLKEDTPIRAQIGERAGRHASRAQPCASRSNGEVAGARIGTPTSWLRPALASATEPARATDLPNIVGRLGKLLWCVSVVTRRRVGLWRRRTRLQVA